MDFIKDWVDLNGKELAGKVAMAYLRETDRSVIAKKLIEDGEDAVTAYLDVMAEVALIAEKENVKQQEAARNLFWRAIEIAIAAV